MILSKLGPACAFCDCNRGNDNTYRVTAALMYNAMNHEVGKYLCYRAALNPLFPAWAAAAASLLVNRRGIGTP